MCHRNFFREECGSTPVTSAASRRAHCSPTSSDALSWRSRLSAHAAMSGPNPSCCTNLRVRPQPAVLTYPFQHSLRVMVRQVEVRLLHLSLASGSMRFSTISDNTSAAAPANPLEAPLSSATSTGTNLRTHCPSSPILVVRPHRWCCPYEHKQHAWRGCASRERFSTCHWRQGQCLSRTRSV